MAPFIYSYTENMTVWSIKKWFRMQKFPLLSFNWVKRGKVSYEAKKSIWKIFWLDSHANFIAAQVYEGQINSFH